jgi:hypothetical protein
MSAGDIDQKIKIAELALKNAGPDQALNGIIDVLREIAKSVETLENSPSKGPSPKSLPGLMVEQPRGRKFRNE